MKLEWFGHACFRISAERGILVFDPYTDGSVQGLRLMRLFADRVICSHEHSDHNAADKIILSGRALPFEVRQISCFHDENGGAKRGKNTISIVTADGLSVAHMGDIGHMLSDEQIAELGKVDILLIPVGGVYTVDAATAFKLYKRIAPKVVVPMHYRMGGRGLQNVAPVDDFLRYFSKSDIHRIGSSWDTADYAISSGVVLFSEPLQL